MRKSLEWLYLGSGVLAGVFLILIAALSLAQICGRLLGFDAYSFDDFAGFCMAASSFLGLAHTYRRNEHIRVALLVDRFSGGKRRVLETLCLTASVFLIGFFACYAIDMAWTSYAISDVSQGLVPVPLWLPQSGMASGFTCPDPESTHENLRHPLHVPEVLRGQRPHRRRLELGGSG